MTMRRLAAGFIAVATLAGSQVVTAGPSSSAPSPSVGNDAVTAERLLRASSDGHVSIRRDSAGHTHYLGTAVDQPVRRPASLPRGATAAVAARAHLTSYGALFGISDQARQLRLQRSTALGKGESAVRFQQLAGGVPVLGGELVVEVDSNGALVSINGETSRLAVPAAGNVSAARAQAVAVGATAKGLGVAASTLTASAAQPWVYDPSIVGAPGPQTARNVWRTEVTGAKGAPLRQLVLIDSVTGGVVLSVDQITTAKTRTVCDLGNFENPNYACPQLGFPVVRGEGDPPVLGDGQVDNAYDFAGKTYDFYQNRFGRDSIDGLGLPLISSVKACPSDDDPPTPGCQFENAFWDGSQMTYGDGFADADDVVGHELTHGVTEKTSNLLYWYESGAINESMSDVFGQFVDLGNNDAQDTNPATRWLIGEDLPFANATRDMANPNASTVGAQPAKTSDPLWDSVWYDAGGVHTNSGVGNKAAELITDGTAGDGGTFNGHTVLPLGLDKAAAIYYRAEQTLTSGSDYRDLYNILRGSCTALASTSTIPKDALGAPSSSGAITTADCAQETEAVAAVEMNLYPTNDAKIPTAPGYCSTGYTVTNLLLEPFEGSLGTNWTSSGAWTRNHDYQPTATSGFTAYVPDDEDTGTAAPGAQHDRRLTTSHAYSIPNGRSSYLRFDHADAFDWYGAPLPVSYWDGGFVEVSVNGAAFKPLGVSANGYNHSIQLTGTPRAGFGGDSTDWYTSRATMSSFAGKQVRFRFRLLTDGFVSLSQSYGWWLDNVRLYSCRGPGAPRSVKVANMLGAKAKMTWRASIPNPGFTIASYVVKISGRPAVTLSASARRRVFRHLTIGHVYTFTIRAKNNRGASSVTVTRRLRIT
jgi:bacillolysin